MENRKPTGKGVIVTTVEKCRAECRAEPRSSIQWQSGILGAWLEWDEKVPHFLGVGEAAKGLVLGRLD